MQLRLEKLYKVDIGWLSLRKTFRKDLIRLSLIFVVVSLNLVIIGSFFNFKKKNKTKYLK
jgi:hypothetical protein